MNIIITGASSGIGAALANAYSKEAKNILLIARNLEKLKTLKRKLEQHCNITIAVCSVTDQEKMITTLNDFDKNNPVDLIFANAGISAGTSGKGEGIEQVSNIFATNINGVVNTIYPLLDKLKERKKGKIILISSMASFRGLPSAPAYSTSKATVRYLGESLRGFLKPFNIKVITICPAYIKSPMTDTNPFPMPLIYSMEKAIKKIRKAVEKNKPILIFPKIIYYTIMLTNLLPKKISDTIYGKLPKK